MIMLTILLLGAAALYVLSIQMPEKAPITGFDVIPQNATTVRITSLAGNSIPANGVKITLGYTPLGLTGLKDDNHNNVWDPGETAMIGTYDLTKPTRVVIAYKNYLLLETTVKFNGAAINNSSVPAYSPGLVATYYRDEVWSAQASTGIAREIRYADDAGAGIGYLSDEPQWPIAEVGQDDYFSVKFAGLLKIDGDANYTFYLTSDDGSYLSIDGAQLIDDGGLHSATEKTGVVHLTQGYHAIEVRMSEHTGQAVVRLEYAAPGLPRTFVTALYHEPGSSPIVDFSAVPTVANAPVTVQFTDNSTDATTWAWDFGDGNTSTQQNPPHTYSADGKYNVKLTAANPIGSSSLTKAQYIQLGSAVPGFTATYYRDESWNTRVALRTVGEIKFADQAGVNIGYYSDEPQWPIAEVGQDDQFSVKFEGVLKIDQEADYSFYLTSDDGSYLSIDGAQLIDDGGLHSATEKTGVVHLTQGFHAVEVRMSEHTGQAVVRLEYSSPFIPRTYVDAVYHAAVTRPTASFFAAPLTASPPATVQFSDASIDATSWAWDFGDGGTSTDRNPVHTYTSNGNYTVRLTASNVIGDETATKPEYVRIGTMRQGFNATYYGDETWNTAIKTEIVPAIRLADNAGVATGFLSDIPSWPIAEVGRDDQFSVKFDGSLKIDTDATYTFYLTSDDGSYLSIDGVQLIDDGGLHSATEKTATVHLTPGYHAIEVRMSEHTGQAVVRLEYSSPGMSRQFVQEVYTI